jgi:RNA recognition motif-containing protein
MSDFIKKLCPIAALVCFVLCILGAMGVIKEAPDQLWKSVGMFFAGVSIFVLFTLLAIPSLASSATPISAKRGYRKDDKSIANKGDDKRTSRPSRPAPRAKSPKAEQPARAEQSAKSEQPVDKAGSGDDEQPAKDENGRIRRDSGEQINDESGPVTLYVCNLSEDTSEPDLREEFGVFGVVKSVRLMEDRETGKSKGYAFVEMSNKAEAKLAMEDINGQEIKGQEVKVSYARRKKYGNNKNFRK